MWPWSKLHTDSPFLASPETAAIFLEQKISADLSTRDGGAGEDSAEDGAEDEDARRWLRMSISWTWLRRKYDRFIRHCLTATIQRRDVRCIIGDGP